MVFCSAHDNNVTHIHYCEISYYRILVHVYSLYKKKIHTSVQNFQENNDVHGKTPYFGSVGHFVVPCCKYLSISPLAGTDPG